MKKIITLLSDFGLRDPYVAEMKGVILTICPGAKIIDITHEVEKFDIRMGAFLLAVATPYFPQGTIHVAVVDPGVGKKRRPIMVETAKSVYVGPDNGLLLLSAQKEGLKHVYHITDDRIFSKEVSRTFHGRDVFAPVAAYLARGAGASRFGRDVLNPVKPSFAEPVLRGGKILGEVLHIDGFGNIITNISTAFLDEIKASEGRLLTVAVDGRSMTLRLCGTYGDAPSSKPLALVGSSSFLEVAVNMGSAEEVFKTKPGGLVEVSLSTA